MDHLRNARGPLAVAVAALVALALVLFAPSTAGANGGGSHVVAKTDEGLMKSRVSGTTDDGRRVAGTFTPSEFTVENGKLMVTGTIDGVIRGKGAPQEFTKDATMQVTDINGATSGALGSGGPGAPSALVGGSCDILNLVLGPLDLDVLGLQVHLDQVVLDIVAESGAGNLLGNLLCAVAGLLDPSTPLEGLLDQLVTLLNQILGQLGL